VRGRKKNERNRYQSEITSREEQQRRGEHRREGGDIAV